jgi:hypothetical protein
MIISTAEYECFRGVAQSKPLSAFIKPGSATRQSLAQMIHHACIQLSNYARANELAVPKMKADSVADFQKRGSEWLQLFDRSAKYYESPFEAGGTWKRWVLVAEKDGAVSTQSKACVETAVEQSVC